MKQGEEKTEFVKARDTKSKKYIFQKNSKTKVAFYFVLTVLSILTIAVIVSGYKF